MKKIIYILIAALIMSVIPVDYMPQALAEEISDSRIKVVYSLGLIEGDELNDLMLDKILTRAETAIVVSKLKYGDTQFTATSEVFSDVDVNHWASGAIELLYDADIINGDGNNNFRPNDGICTAELYKILLYMAGYSSYMESVGEFPDNVMKTANMTGLSKGVNLPADKTLTRKEAFIIIYNLLKIKTMTISFKGGENTYKNGSYYMEEQLEIYKEKGIIGVIEDVVSNGQTVIGGKVTIGDAEYINEAGVGAADMGLYGEYYYKYDDMGFKVLLCFVPLSNNTITISSTDIISYASNKYTYSASGRRKTVNINPAKDIIYNDHIVYSEYYNEYSPKFDENGDPVIDDNTGLQVIDKTEVSYMTSFYGEIMLIDNDSDDQYDVVRIYDYQNMLCSYVSDKNETIYGTILGRNVGIDLSKLDEYTIKDTKGKDIALRNLSDGDLLMLQYYNVNKGLAITVCDKTIEGKITGTRLYEDEKFIELNGAEYRIAASNAYGDKQFGMNSTAVLGIDIFGNVGAVIKYYGSEWAYGFVMKVSKGAIEEDKPISIMLMTDDGEIKEFEFAEKVRLDGVAASSEELAEAVVYGKVVRYYLNNDRRISKIDTPLYKNITDWSGSVDENNALLERVSKATTMCKTTNKAFYNDKTAVFYDTDTIFLQVPNPGNTVLTSYDRGGQYLRRYSTNLTHKGIYTIAAYNSDPEKITADLILLYENEALIPDGSQAMLIDKVTQTVDEDNELTYLLSGMYMGQKVDYPLKDASLVYVDNHKLQSGDIIRIRVTAKKITNVRLIYSINSPRLAGSIFGEGKNTTTSTNYNAEWKYEFGWVERVQYPNIVFRRNTQTSSENEYSFYNAVNYFNIYIYDKSESKDHIRVGTINDIKSRDQYPNSYDTVITGVESTNGEVLILIRD